MAIKRVVITGLGVISPIGIGKEVFSDELFRGTDGIKPISLFDASQFKQKLAGEVTDFTPENLLGAKGLRVLDRSTKLISCAAKLALDDAGLAITEENSRQVGVAIGTTFGSIKSISDFDREALVEGPRYVNPAFFPNTVINSPASQVSIRFGIKGFNTTISTGFCASLDALGYAANFIRLNRASAVLAGGVEELCIQTFLGFYKTGCMAGIKDDSTALSCPFDRRRNGIVLGEGSVVFVLEDLEAALARKASIYAEVLGFASTFHKEQGLQRSMQLALAKSNFKPGHIDYISSGANSSVDGDKHEAEAIEKIFSHDIPVSAVKSMTGECYSAGAAMQMLAAVCAINKQMVPPTINYKEKDPACALNIVADKACSRHIVNVLINAYESGGASSSQVIAKFTE